MIRAVLDSLGRMATALGRSDADAPPDSFALLRQEWAHVAVGWWGVLTLGPVWGCLLWAAVQGRQAWRERRWPGQRRRARDIGWDTAIAVGPGLWLWWVWPGAVWWIGIAPGLGIAAAVLATGRAVSRDIGQRRAAEGDEWSWM